MQRGKLSNAAATCAMSPWGRSKENSLLHLTGLRTKSSASSSDSSASVVSRTRYCTPQVLFVSFVVKQPSTSLRSLPFDSFSLLTHLK